MPDTLNDTLAAPPAATRIDGPIRGSAIQVAAALTAAAIVVAGLYLGRELWVPIVLAVLLAFVLAPLVSLLQRARLGQAPAVLIAVLLAFVAIGGLGTLVGMQVSTLAYRLPTYGHTIQAKVDSLHLGGGVVSRAQAAAATMLASTGPGVVLGPLSTLGVVVVFVIFVLLGREDLRDRLVRLVGRQDLHRTILALNDAARRLSRYFLIQLALNTGFGVFIALGLWWVGLPNPVLWGILAALMRFVPFIGTFIAVVPPLLLALAVAPGFSTALIVLALFLLSELVMGQAIEPLLYGQSTGLSPIAVIGSATFWGFLWGPVGLLIATPLTVCLVVAGRHVQALAFLDVIFGDSPPLDPQETFYQRALEGNARELLTQARVQIAAGSVAEYFDRTALPGLALAQADLARDALAFDRLEAIHAHIETLLAGIAAAAHLPSPPASDGPPIPPEWREPGAVLCISGRGQLDGLAATMAMQVLRDAGFGAACESNLALGAGRPRPPRPPLLCCLSVLEDGSSPSSVRYLLRRIERQMPGAAAVVGLWHASGASPMLAALRSEGREETIVLSLGELAALVRAVSARK